MRGTSVVLAWVAVLLAGCDSARPASGEAVARAHHVLKVRYHLDRAKFSHETPGYSSNVICGLVSADNGGRRILDVEFIANGDTDSAVINDQALSFAIKPSDDLDAPAATADCIFPQIWKAMCRQSLSNRLIEQEKRCTR